MNPLGVNSSFIPGLAMPDELLMQGPQFTDDSLLGEYMGGGGLADIFSQDVLESAKSAVAMEFQFLFGNIQLNIDVLIVLSSDSPVLPVGGSSPAQPGAAALDSEAPPVGDADAVSSLDSLSMNSWFSVNLLVALTTNMIQMEKEMRLSSLSELASTLVAMDMIIDFARNVADSIIKSAEKQAAMYTLQAVAGILQAVGGFVQMGMAGASTVCNMKSTKWEANADGTPGGQFVNPKTNKPFAINSFCNSGGATAIGSVFTGLGQTISGFGQAALTLEKAEFDAWKEVQEALKQLYQQILQSSSEAQKDLKELIKNTLDQLAQITTANRKSQGISPTAQA